MNLTVENTDSLKGVVSAPPSKAYTHRMVIAVSLSSGVSKIYNPLISDDTQATLEAVKALGAETEIQENYLIQRWISSFFEPSFAALSSLLTSPKYYKYTLLFYFKNIYAYLDGGWWRIFVDRMIGLF